ncbi:hypothetical protein BDR06DRAFT_965404, partial [Suillus hirtellus]
MAQTHAHSGQDMLTLTLTSNCAHISDNSELVSEGREEQEIQDEWLATNERLTSGGKASLF